MKRSVLRAQKDVSRIYCFFCVIISQLCSVVVIILVLLVLLFIAPLFFHLPKVNYTFQKFLRWHKLLLCHFLNLQTFFVLLLLLSSSSYVCFNPGYPSCSCDRQSRWPAQAIFKAAGFMGNSQT